MQYNILLNQLEKASQKTKTHFGTLIFHQVAKICKSVLEHFDQVQKERFASLIKDVSLDDLPVSFAQEYMEYIERKLVKAKLLEQIRIIIPGFTYKRCVLDFRNTGRSTDTHVKFKNFWASVFEKHYGELDPLFEYLKYKPLSGVYLLQYWKCKPEMFEHYQHYVTEYSSNRSIEYLLNNSDVEYTDFLLQQVKERGYYIKNIALESCSLESCKKIFATYVATYGLEKLVRVLVITLLSIQNDVRNVYEYIFDYLNLPKNEHAIDILKTIITNPYNEIVRNLFRFSFIVWTPEQIINRIENYNQSDYLLEICLDTCHGMIKSPASNPTIYQKTINAIRNIKHFSPGLKLIKLEYLTDEQRFYIRRLHNGYTKITIKILQEELTRRSIPYLRTDKKMTLIKRLEEAEVQQSTTKNTSTVPPAVPSAPKN